MGIKGLLPFLSSIQREVNISSFSGQTAACDAYCWLHKGAYSCAMQLVMKTEKLDDLPFIRYCMKRVNLLRRFDIKPIVVFDGSSLPIKANTETERRAKRKENLQMAKALLNDGKKSEALNCFQRCVDVTPEMALAFIKACRREGVEVVVAPYEADSQLAYLAKEGIADVVITEDSDLLAFGCKQVLFKMTDNGDGKLIRLSDIGKANKSLVGFTPDSFRHMCILCGCDYLPSVSGVGPGKASKLMHKFGQDAYRVIKALKYDTRGKVPETYEHDFRRADYAFRYQLVFDPRSQQQVRLNSLPPDTDAALMDFAGVQSSPSKAVGLARGNLNPFTLEVMDSYSPSKAVPPKSKSWSGSESGSSSKSSSQQRLSFSVQVQAKIKGKKVREECMAEDSLSESDFHRLYGGGGRVVRSVVATEPVSKTEARPPARVMNRFAVASEPKKQVLSHYFTREEQKEDQEQRVDQEKEEAREGFRSGIAALKEMENRQLERHDSGVGESMSSSVEEYDTACSQDDMLTPPIEPSVKKRLSFNHGDDDVTERLSKRPRFNEYGDVSSSDSEECTNSDSEQLDSELLHSRFKTSEDFIMTRNDVVAQSNSYDLVDLTSVQAPSVGYQHYSVFTPKPLQPAANKLPSLASSRQKGGGGANSNIRVGLSRKSSQSRFRVPRQEVPRGSSTLTNYYQFKGKPKMTH